MSRFAPHRSSNSNPQDTVCQQRITVEMAIMNSVRRRPKAIHYHIYSASDMGIHFKKRSLYLRLIKEHIKGSLFFAVSAHLLQVASELAQHLRNRAHPLYQQESNPPQASDMLLSSP